VRDVNGHDRKLAIRRQRSALNSYFDELSGRSTHDVVYRPYDQTKPAQNFQMRGELNFQMRWKFRFE
jgi:hypothetical protein